MFPHAIPFAMWTPGVWELGLIVLLVLILFGAGKLPQVFGQMGAAVKSFKDAQKDELDGPQLTEANTDDAHDVQEVKAEKLEA